MTFVSVCLCNFWTLRFYNVHPPEDQLNIIANNVYIFLRTIKTFSADHRWATAVLDFNVSLPFCREANAICKRLTTHVVLIYYNIVLHDNEKYVVWYFSRKFQSVLKNDRIRLNIFFIFSTILILLDSIVTVIISLSNGFLLRMFVVTVCVSRQKKLKYPVT